MPSRAAAAADVSTAAGAVVTISLGRPVLPPLATAFSSGDMLGVKRRTGSSAGTDSSTGQSPASASGTPTTSDGRATSRRATRSAAGSRLEMGCGTAPTAHAANMLTTKSVELGRPIETLEPLVTPRLSNNPARRSTLPRNSARVSVTGPQVRDDRFGARSAPSRRADKKVVPATSQTIHQVQSRRPEPPPARWLPRGQREAMSEALWPQSVRPAKYAE